MGYFYQRAVRGSDLLGYLGFTVSLLVLWSGGQGLYNTTMQPHPVSVSYSDLIQNKPSAKWMEIRGGQINLLESNYTEFLGMMMEVHVPLRPAGNPDKNGAVHMMVLLDDARTLDLVRQMIQADEKGNLLEWAIDHQRELILQRSFRGTVKPGNEGIEIQRKDLARLNGNLASDYMVLREGTEPSFWSALVFFIVGIAGSTLLIWKGSKEIPKIEIPDRGAVSEKVMSKA